MGQFDAGFSWLGEGRGYMMHGRQYSGTVMNRAASIKVRNRPRGGGTVLNLEVPADLKGQLVVGTRTSVGKFIQGLTSSYEVTGTLFDQRPYALNTTSENEPFARWFIEQENVVQRIDEMMNALSGFEIRAIRFERQLASLVISHPEASVFQPENSQRLMELLVQLAITGENPSTEVVVPTIEPTEENEPSVVQAEVIDESDDDDVISRVQVVDPSE